MLMAATKTARAITSVRHGRPDAITTTQLIWHPAGASAPLLLGVAGVFDIESLLLAFAPLRFTLQGGAASALALWGLVSTGIVRAVISLYSEVRG